MHKSIRVLVTSNSLNHEGGVVNYYNILFRNNKLNDLQFYHTSIGSPSALFYFPTLKKIFYPFQLLIAWSLIAAKILKYKINIVQVNPSFIPVPIFRDFVTLIICKILKRKCIVFFRGWDESYYNKILKSKIKKYLFISILKKSDKILVLASAFKNNLINLGIDENKIVRTTTVIDESKVVKPTNRLNEKKIKILYLGRISQLKGIDELTDAIIKLYNNHPELITTVEFVFVGHEHKRGYINELKQKLKDFINLNCVNFVGRVESDEKFHIYSDSDIYVFPSWSEGCPNSVLEALASGLFVISTNVGALNDIIEPLNNGIFVNKQNADDLYDKILFTIENIESIREKKELIHKRYIQEFSSHKILNFVLNLYNIILYDNNCKSNGVEHN